MKRTAMVCLLLALLAAAVVTPADAAKTSPENTTRRATATYANPALGAASGTGGAACLPCPTFVISSLESAVKMQVRDDASPAPVAFDIRQRSAEGGCCDQVAGPFCGSTGKRPVKLTPGLDVLVFVYASGDLTCPGAFGTTGTVKAVFSSGP